MSNDLQSLETWAGALLSKLQPAQIRQVNRKVAQDLRRSQVSRIASQRNPDGTPFEPRKNKNLRGKKGRIKRRKDNMFVKLRTARYLKIESDENQIAVGFIGRVARLARVHQEGLTDRVSAHGPQHKYPSRKLLGFTQTTRDLIRDSLLKHITT